LKRITITLDDEIHTSLTDYARDRSKQDFSRSNLSSAVRKLLAEKLEELGYFPETNNVARVKNEISLPPLEKDSRSYLINRLIVEEGRGRRKYTSGETQNYDNGDDNNLRENNPYSIKSHDDRLYSISLRRGTTKPTIITCKADLSWKVMKEYLKSLKSLGFVQGSTDNEETRTTTTYGLSGTAFGMLKQYLRIEK
jgi:predicted transcriptional regulator